MDQYTCSGHVTGHPLQVQLQMQWTLLEGIDHGANEINGLARLLAGRRDGAHAELPRRAAAHGRVIAPPLSCVNVD